MYEQNDLTIRPIKENDLHRIWTLIYKEEQPEWKKWDGPYFPHQSKSYDDFLKDKANWIDDESFWAIEVNGIVSGIVCGIVSYYWEHKPSHWLEVGIVLHEAQSWGHGVGACINAMD